MSISSSILNPPHLPFDILTVIAHISIPTYRALLALPRFGRASLSHKHQILHQSSFIIHTIDKYGCETWHINHSTRRMLHRLDGPSIIDPNECEIWYFNGRYHRLDGPAVTWADGTQEWFHHGQYHRIDGPAVIKPHGEQSYILYGTFHRANGPAIIYPNGDEEYWLNGIQTTKENILNIPVQ
jgi:hypothetical protein